MGSPLPSWPQTVLPLQQEQRRLLVTEDTPFPGLQGTLFLETGLRGGQCSAATPSRA